MRFDVFGMCNALYDVQAKVDDAVLDELGLAKGGMFLIDDARREAVVELIEPCIVNAEAGGSGANTMAGIALLGGAACYTSRVGRDAFGAQYRESLVSRGVHANLGAGSGPTGMSVILVTPDAQRTMLTYLGESRELHRDDIVAEDIAGSRYLYVTGYLWDTDGQKDAVLYAMHQAAESGTRVAFSLADGFCVERNREDFLSLLQEHVHVVFANADEAESLTGAGSASEAAAQLGTYCEVVAVTDGARGSVLRAAGETVCVSAYPVAVVDTTGAGDMYAAGLLYGLARELPLAAAGRIASLCAARVVARMGPRLDRIDATEIARLGAA